MEFDMVTVSMNCVDIFSCDKLKSITGYLGYIFSPIITGIVLIVDIGRHLDGNVPK